MAALVFSVFGVGKTVGNLVVPRFADRALMPTAGMLLAGSALMLALYPFAAAHFWTITADVFLIGVGGALATVLQTRLMDDYVGCALALGGLAVWGISRSMRLERP